jgi:K+-sensing histidine kinase KdpD
MAAIAFAVLLLLIIRTDVNADTVLAHTLGFWAGSLCVITAPLWINRTLLQAAAKASQTDGELAQAAIDAVYAAPRRAALSTLGGSAVVLLFAVFSISAIHAVFSPTECTLFSLCLGLAAPLAYVFTRTAARPLAALLPMPAAPIVPSVTGASDQFVSRLSLAFAAPAVAAAIAATLVISTRAAHLRADGEDTLREQATELLALSLREDGPDDGALSAAEALRHSGLPVVHNSTGALTIRAQERSLTTLPSWGLLFATLAGIVAIQLARRVAAATGHDVSEAASEMSTVSPRDIRSVTMHIARPQSVPEVRDTALALDTLAAALLRMNDDRARALTVRTEAARVRSFVLASISHDLRAPLNSVLGFADLLLSGAEGEVTAEQRTSLEALRRGGVELLRLVRDFLDQARLDAGRMVIEHTRVSVDELIERAREEVVLRSRVELTPEAITLEGEVGLHVLGDFERLSYAAGVFVAFALLRSGSNGRVAVRVRGEGDLVLLTVHGGGTTPSREALAHMFEPYDFAPSGARAPAGISLAASVARGVIRLHSGQVRAMPSPEGGIVLVVELPVTGTV